MKLKRTLMIAVVAALAGLMAPAPLRAQPAGADAQGRMGQFQERMRQALAEMNLNDNQKQQLREVLQEQAQRMRVLMEDQDLSREEKGQKLRQMGEDLDPKLKDILTAEQYQSWQKKREESQKQSAGQAGGAQASLQDRMKAIFAELNLTPEQQEKIKAVFEGQRDKYREIFQDQNLSREQKMAKMKELDQDLQPKLKEILTPEQYEKYEKKRAEMRTQAGLQQKKKQ